MCIKILNSGFRTNLGVKKGDRVAIYLPMIIELVIAMLACARIGAIHSIVVGSFLHVVSFPFECVAFYV